MEHYNGKNRGLLKDVAASENNPNWKYMIKRENEINDGRTILRNDFQRDYTRVLYSNAYKRMKNKTQVFFSPTNDHICTRIEHVNLVESISYTIAKELGLNTELTRAIAVAHDIGHGPFGHKGERILNDIAVRDVGKTFWHEKNGLNCVDNVELLENGEGIKKNLNLTYAVRDGIISHCGEVDEEKVYPRWEAIDLGERYTKIAEYQPYTWEGCAVKISDKISYIGRDIEDAIRFKILTEGEIEELKEILRFEDIGYTKLNNTNIVNMLIEEVISNVSLEEGFSLSKEGLYLLNNIKAFNYRHIYRAERVTQSDDYFNLVLNKIYEVLKSIYNVNTHRIDIGNKMVLYPRVISGFINWLGDYSIQDYFVEDKRKLTMLDNKKLFNLDNEKDFYWAIIIYISGMTDNKAIKTFENIISF